MLAILLLADAAFIAVHIGVLSHGLAGNMKPSAVGSIWLIGQDRSVPEYYQYAKWLLVSGLLAWKAW